mmetsp:Transcript_84051/g.175814  ORF Transcript_84051/g.175814 Transcript_84051/m.175814 type:complete len:206 (+) Transcript_84051:401-1018(+)
MTLIAVALHRHRHRHRNGLWNWRRGSEGSGGDWHGIFHHWSQGRRRKLAESLRWRIVASRTRGFAARGGGSRWGRRWKQLDAVGVMLLLFFLLLPLRRWRRLRPAFSGSAKLILPQRGTVPWEDGDIRLDWAVKEAVLSITPQRARSRRPILVTSLVSVLGVCGHLICKILFWWSVSIHEWLRRQREMKLPVLVCCCMSSWLAFL